MDIFVCHNLEVFHLAWNPASLSRRDILNAPSSNTKVSPIVCLCIYHQVL